MEAEIKPRKLRIVTGSVADLEDQLNWLVLLHNSVLMQRAIAQPGIGRPS